MYRIAVAMILGGGFVFWVGLGEFKLGLGASQVPLQCALSQLENGTEAPDKHLTIGEHWALFPAWVGWGKGGGDKLDRIYYPIVSQDHPFNQAWDAVIEKYGDNEIPEDETPRLKSLGVLVKSRRFKTASAIPEEWKQVAAITGLIINGIGELSNQEENLLREQFPDLVLADIMILQEGREPKSRLAAVGMMLLGVLLVAGGGAIFVPVATRAR